MSVFADSGSVVLIVAETPGGAQRTRLTETEARELVASLEDALTSLRRQRGSIVQTAFESAACGD